MVMMYNDQAVHFDGVVASSYYHHGLMTLKQSHRNQVVVVLRFLGAVHVPLCQQSLGDHSYQTCYAILIISRVWQVLLR